MPVTILSTDSPDLPLPLPELADRHGQRVMVRPGPRNHVVLIDGRAVLYAEAHGRRLWRLERIPEAQMTACVERLKAEMQDALSKEGRRIWEIESINDQPAAACGLAQIFQRHGLRQVGQTLVWRF